MINKPEICFNCNWWKWIEEEHLGLCNYQATSTIPPREFMYGISGYAHYIKEKGLRTNSQATCQYYNWSVLDD